MSTQAVRALTAASVVIDVDLAAGRSLDAVAAYAAMVAFAEMGPEPAEPAGSILGLFGRDDAPTDLTDRDRQFLRGLYALSLDRTARRHRGRLVQALVDPAKR